MLREAVGQLRLRLRAQSGSVGAGMLMRELNRPASMITALLVGNNVFNYFVAFGMTAILIAVGLFSGSVTALPRSGQWMIWVKRVAAVIMLAMAEYYFVTAGYNL